MRRGRFNLRINFAATAPSGNATIEVFRGKKKIGSAKTRRAPRRLQARQRQADEDGPAAAEHEPSKRLRVKVRVRVGRRVLRTKPLTIRR